MLLDVLARFHHFGYIGIPGYFLVSVLIFLGLRYFIKLLLRKVSFHMVNLLALIAAIVFTFLYIGLVEQNYCYLFLKAHECQIVSQEIGTFVLSILTAIPLLIAFLAVQIIDRRKVKRQLVK